MAAVYLQESICCMSKHVLDIFYLVQIAHSEVKKRDDLPVIFKHTLAEQLPNIDTFDDETLEDVCDIFVRKVTNTIIQATDGITEGLGIYS